MEIEALLSALGVAEKLKDATRHSWTSGGRQESVADHSWRMAVMACLAADEFPGLDMAKVVRMCLFHDMGEAFTGDVPVFEKTAAHEEEEARRLDAWLAGQLPDVTRSAAARLCEEGRVTAAGKPLAKNYRLGGGEAVSVTLPDPEPVDVAPQDIPLDVVYEDSDVIVVNKPKGLVVHPAPGHPDGTLVNALLHHCGDSLSGIGGELRPGIVHRIDRDTSGLLIAAKNDFAHQKLSAQLQDHTLARIYRCIVIGNLREDSGTVDAPIGRHPADRKKMAVVAGGRSAVTHWSVLERFPGYTYVECRLETGRTHQIRVHMAHIGHPILGDTVYGAKKPVPGLQGQCLHAVGLRFLHPRTGELVELWCDLPEAFQTQLRKLENRG